MPDRHGAPGPREERTPQRHAAVHHLLGQGVGLLEHPQRLGISLNTVKRYARVEGRTEPERVLPSLRGLPMTVLAQRIREFAVLLIHRRRRGLHLESLIKQSATEPLV
ncbi:hypothetical protein [Saccharothrix coeruleofusca]|uniref:Uncharacterized protein n=1 Tax=Saccharothrix coeruleofusca TaxID=33919 RepID=A0A918ARK7_9PSEU|nr:hypothetical protein [Saccharothrix coeruleofusca]GGP73917.1 hypothetical protein GCM10010185_54260 [Saccharothrix coeruleofusca]